MVLWYTFCLFSCNLTCYDRSVPVLGMQKNTITGVQKKWEIFSTNPSITTLKWLCRLVLTRDIRADLPSPTALILTVISHWRLIYRQPAVPISYVTMCNQKKLHIRISEYRNCRHSLNICTTFCPFACINKTFYSFQIHLYRCCQRNAHRKMHDMPNIHKPECDAAANSLSNYKMFTRGTAAPLVNWVFYFNQRSIYLNYSKLFQKDNCA